MRSALVATVQHREAVTSCHVLLRLEAPEVAAAARPGQFVHVRVSDTCDPLLRRPFSVMQAVPSRGLIDLLVQIVGRGSEQVAAAVPGQRLSLLGPLGEPFPLPPPGPRLFLVAGGVGVAPLLFLAETLARSSGDHDLTGLFGARTEALLCCWQELAGRCREFTAVTEDGSVGTPGLVTDVLAEQLDGTPGEAVVYACGPGPMLAAVAADCRERGVAAFVSLERWMGCGVGACLGCVVPSARPAGPRYLRVCADGPVFAAADLDWGAMVW